MTQAPQYRISFTVGDFSQDGHGMSETFYVDSSVPVQDLRELHYAAKDHLGFDIGDICKKYEHPRISEDMYETLSDFGVTDDLVWIDEDTFTAFGCKTNALEPEDVFALWLRILRVVGERNGTPVDLVKVSEDTPVPLSPQILSSVLEMARKDLPPGLEAISVQDVADLLAALTAAAEKTGNCFAVRLTPQDQQRPPSMHFYGYDEQKRHLNVPGYGTFLP